MAARWVGAGLLIGTVALGACSSSPKGAFTAPSGAEQAAWDEYCRFSGALIRSLDTHADGTVGDEVFAVALGRYREGLARIAESMSDRGSEVGTIVETIDRLRLMVNHEHSHGHGEVETHEDEPPLDVSEVRAAVDALPECVEAP